jgi:hypothetical protein
VQGRPASKAAGRSASWRSKSLRHA